jgi:hypothetical protein
MATMNEFRARGTDMSSPGTDIVPIDLSVEDQTPAVPYRSIFVGGTAGDVKVDTLGGTARTVPLLTGAILPVTVTKIYKTGTTATSVFGIL